MRPVDNPFRASRMDALRYRAARFDWAELLDRLVRLGGRGAIRGACGTGKSTLLQDLEERLGRRGLDVRRLRPDPDDRALARRQLDRFRAAVDGSTALLLDGADRVGSLAWCRLRLAARPAAALVVTTHREGRLPTLHRCLATPEILAELVRELDGEREGEEIDELFAASRGNLRLALRAAYDRAAGG